MLNYVIVLHYCHFRPYVTTLAIVYVCMQVAMYMYVQDTPCLETPHTHTPAVAITNKVSFIMHAQQLVVFCEQRRMDVYNITL